MGGWEEIDHTADYALRVWGSDLRDLLENGARGFLELVLGPERPAAERWEEYEVTAEEAALLLPRTVRELLYRLDSGELPVEVAVTAATEQPARALVRVGLTRRPDPWQYVLRAVKAVTYHDVDLRRDEQGLSAVLTLDT
ncbi:MAG TPA: archease [Armatimonadota bacterium]|jgi:SHS2 domain-containing protein